MTTRELNIWIVKIIALIITWIIALIPTEICAFLWVVVLHPDTFWEKLSLIAVTIFAGGAIQIGLVVLGIWVSGFILIELE